MLDFEWEGHPEMQQMQELFNSLEAEALYMSHYDLAKKLGGTATDWKDFITEPHVADYITQELRILKQTELSKVLKNISSNARSVGTAQLLSALTKALDGERTKSGPAFVYCYIPLTPNEMAAPNVQVLQSDPFRRD